jgi:hypothetical protein
MKCLTCEKETDHGKKKHTPKRIVAKLRQVDALLREGGVPPKRSV